MKKQSGWPTIQMRLSFHWLSCSYLEIITRSKRGPLHVGTQEIAYPLHYPYFGHIHGSYSQTVVQSWVVHAADHGMQLI